MLSVLSYPEFTIGSTMVGKVLRSLENTILRLFFVTSVFPKKITLLIFLAEFT